MKTFGNIVELVKKKIMNYLITNIVKFTTKIIKNIIKIAKKSPVPYKMLLKLSKS